MSSTTRELERSLPRDIRLVDPLKPLGILLLAAGSIVAATRFPQIWKPNWTAVIPAALILIIIGVMTWPMAGIQRYFAYKRPLFIASIVLELWILLGGVAVILPSAVPWKAIWFQVFLVSFFLLTAICSLPWMTGEYRKGLFFRPDLLFGGGCYVARGEIFVALGVKLMTVTGIAHPIWNWWGLAWAVAAMVIMIPLRGIVKMRMRRARMLGLDNWMGPGFRLGLWVKEVFLFVALLALVYGFANVYMGRTPFTWSPGQLVNSHGHGEWTGLIVLGVAFLILVPIRGWYKTRIPEPATILQDLSKAVILWLGFLPLIYGFFVVFMGQWLPFHCCGYYNFWWGVWVSALGFLMIVPLRTITLRDEFRGTIGTMIPRMADLPDAVRGLMMGRRLQVLSAMAERPRVENMKLMMRIIQNLADEARQKLVKTRTELVADASPEQRAILMGAMAVALAELPQSERTGVMTEVMGAVSELPQAKRRIMMRAMLNLME